MSKPTFAIKEISFKDAGAFIAIAITKLLSTPKDHRPYVRVESSERKDAFVQFAGSDGEPLKLDVPGIGFLSEYDSTAECMQDAYYMMRYIFGVGESDAVRVLYETSTPSAALN